MSSEFERPQVGAPFRHKSAARFRAAMKHQRRRQARVKSEVGKTWQEMTEGERENVRQRYRRRA